MSKNIIIYYNSQTFNRLDPDIFIVANKNDSIYTYITNNADYIITFTYKKITIIVNYLVDLYLILQYIYNENSVYNLTYLNINKIKYKITSNKKKNKYNRKIHHNICSLIYSLHSKY